MAREAAVATTATAGRAATGIVLAGDRTVARVAARRHSTFVRLLKFVLPSSAIVVAGLYGASVLSKMGIGSGLGSLEIPKILPENLAMQNPHYEGYTKDGGKYWVKADRAQQDLKNLNFVKLIGITGEILDGKKQTTTLKATRGTFDSKANLLELYERITIVGDNGLKADLTRATVKTKENIILSNEPVAIEMTSGRITAKRMTARQKVKEYTFVEDVKTHFKGKEKTPATAAAESSKTDDASLLGSTNGPVDISSNRLDINDETKVALFTGGVTAVQNGASLTTPELEVQYEGGSAGKGKLPQAGEGGSLKRMFAKNPVVMRQANGNTVSSRSANFDPANKRALLEGDVVMEQGTDKRVTADVADLDQAANTVLLTGDVKVTQGGNLLQGRRLIFNRETNKLQLTAPGPTGNGRISARFIQKPGVTSPKAAQPGSTRGISFGATFKTDPNAPVNIEAARLDVDDGSKRAIFTGNVRAVQGDFNLKANELTATYTGSAGLGGDDSGKQAAAQLSHIRARNKVELTSKDGQRAMGDWADFDPKANTATLGGNVVLSQGDNIVRGTKLVIDMNTGESVIKTEAASRRAGSSGSGSADAGTGGSGARPSATFYPGQFKANSSRSKKSGTVDGWQARSKQ